MNPIDFVCPNCNAQPGESCTQPTSFGRYAVTWFHDSRRPEFVDPLNDPRFPDRPNHPDFWRLSEVGMAHDAEAVETKGGLKSVIDTIIDEASLLYAAEHRLGNGGMLTPDMHPNVKARLMAIFIDGFCMGVDYEKRGGHRDA